MSEYTRYGLSTVGGLSLAYAFNAMLHLGAAYNCERKLESDDHIVSSGLARLLQEEEREQTLKQKVTQCDYYLRKAFNPFDE